MLYKIDDQHRSGIANSKMISNHHMSFTNAYPKWFINSIDFPASGYPGHLGLSI